MNLQHPVISQVTTRQHTARLSPGLILAASLFLATPGLLTAAPTPKPTVTPAVTPAATPMASPVAATPAAAVSASPAPDTVAKYSGAQQMEYIATAGNAFVAARQAKSQAFLDAHKDLDAAGGISPKGLTSKEAVAARRDLLAKCIAGNDEYIDFVKTQEDTYRAELAKTPLVPNDVTTITSEFASHANTPGIVQLRETEREVLKCGDDMMAFLDKTYGEWSVNAVGRLTFKKKASVATYGAMSQKYNKLVMDVDKMRTAINATAPVPSAGATPAASPAASMSPTPAASPVAPTKPTH